jgi:hypothetical protein
MTFNSTTSLAIVRTCCVSARRLRNGHLFSTAGQSSQRAPGPQPHRERRRPRAAAGACKVELERARAVGHHCLGPRTDQLEPTLPPGALSNLQRWNRAAASTASGRARTPHRPAAAQRPRRSDLRQAATSTPGPPQNVLSPRSLSGARLVPKSCGLLRVSVCRDLSPLKGLSYCPTFSGWH